MVAMYNIAGRQIGSHWLAIATLTAITSLTFASTGGSSAKKTQGPPINAQSPDEESFIKEFLKNAEGGEKGSSADAAKKDAKR
ncbi:hypothetical protein OIDMADRAFT_180668 [Oidiodendron maius Zn]|uniref:ATP synthase subunit K, mitochondrial n=1 Tax=Oidiodendron maius (strain Zn) TaxID=913774 RepID=A0A0C3DEM9_OIDMZ|nr:hypothetical protein OIDMADRAFT_180668 [Oidiodendron maius Zn]